MRLAVKHPEVHRQKFEFYIGQGANGARSAATVAKKYLDDALGKAWPPGCALEAEFFVAMAERIGGGSPKDYEAKLRAIISKATGNDATIANRANVQLAHSLRESKDAAGARKIYEDLANKNGVVASAADGLGMGIGFTIMLTIMGGAREILGNGSIFGVDLYGSAVSPALAMILPPGGFLAFGTLIGIVNVLSNKKITQVGCESCAAACKRNATKEGQE